MRVIPPPFTDEIEIDGSRFDHVHDRFDCSTFTNLAIPSHERKVTNWFGGTSQKAFDSNLRFHYKARRETHTKPIPNSSDCM